MTTRLTKEQLQAWFDKAADYEEYLSNAGNKAAPWYAIGKQAQISETQKELLASFVREMKVLVISGIWCGDCSAQGPMLAAIAEESPKIDLRWLDRDDSIELSDQIKINAGNRVPTVLFMAEDFEFVSVLGDRTLSRYRAISARQLGDVCDIPGIATPQDEFDATLQEWLNEFERVQLLLRLSGRLRQKHGD
ncbi:MAG: thioredoxin family protein [Phycisphaerales bacterium]|nr:thioredoxin family protein [Planctomycetota bacterium]MBL6997085.1 thioredoxin family protein [Phycisphaerales bacterium]